MHNKYGRNVVFQPEALYNLKKNYPSTKILGWYSLKINHVLAAKDEYQKIEKIYSHPQAILQCKKEIQKMKGVETIATPSTTSQIKLLQDNEAVICNREAAKKNNLMIINKNFAPSDNVTDFAIVTTKKNITEKLFKNLTQNKVLFVLSLKDKK
jgi:prephenate dehydratase